MAPSQSSGGRPGPASRDDPEKTAAPADSRTPDPWLTERLEQLQRISIELTGALTEGDVATILMAALDTPGTTATHGLWLHRPETGCLDMIGQAGMPEHAVRRFSTVDLDSSIPVAVAHRERRTVETTTQAESEEEFPDLRGTLRLTDGFVAVPLLIDDRSLGALSLGYNRQPSREDVLFMEAIAGQVAQTLIRVRLSSRERRRRGELEFLVELTEAAMSATDHGELMRNVTSAAVPTLGDWCAVHFLPADGGPVEVAVAHVDPARISWAEDLQTRYPYDPDRETGVAAVIRSGTTEYISTLDAAAIDDAVAHAPMGESEARSILDELGLTSVITVPLQTKLRTVGAIQFVTAESGRQYDADDVALAEVVAGRLAEPLDSAWMNDQQARIAGALQRNLLPPRLPMIAGVDIAARYLPAGISEVGGDFYDVFAIGDQSWAILIGDACGTGPNAAALSSIARHTVRAGARHGLEHVDVVEWLNQAVSLSDRDLFCTACYATLTLDAGDWVLRSASAGHPLPIISRSGRSTTIGQPGTLLGVFDDAPVTVTKVTLSPGDVVVFYTDGVTDLPPPYDLAAEDLARLVERLDGRGSADEIADGIETSIIERVSEPQRADDVAIVVARIGAP